MNKIKGSMTVIFLIVLLLVIGGVYKATKQPSSSTKNGKMQVAVSFYPLYFFASNIAGDKAEVFNITPSGTEPHDYEPTAQDMASIEQSSLLILNGAKLEAWGNKIKDELKGKDLKIIMAGDSLATQQFEEEGETIQDPHVWLSPSLAKQEIYHILQGFIEKDANNKYYYEENANKLKQKIDDLDQKYKKGLAQCTQKDFVTSHSAFGYLAKAYGLNQVPISGVSPDEEPSAQQLAEVADFAKKNNVKYIFFESLISPKLSETIAQEIGAQTLVLDPIEGISEEDMEQGKNYFTIMEDNLKNLRTALECT